MRNSQIIPSDDDIRQKAKAEGKSDKDIADLMAEREANNRAVQADYDGKPPARPYTPPQE